MPRVHRNKHQFTSGEISPVLWGKTDFAGMRDGCYKLLNAAVVTQGPATRRSGTRFIYDLADVGLESFNPKVRLVPFIFNEFQAYTMVFFEDGSGNGHIVFAYEDGLIVYPDPPPTECPPGTPQDPPAVAGAIVSIDLPAGFDIEAFDYAQSSDYMYFSQPDLAPYVLQRFDHYCWTITEVAFTDAPTEWNDSDGWPERVTFHQQRLVFAGHKTKRQTVWMSMAGWDNRHNFGPDDPANLVASDPITFTLDSQTQNKIQWILSNRTLNIGTVGNEWTVSGGTQESLTPANVNAKNQSSYGSEPNLVKLAGQAMIYVQRHGRVIAQFTYDMYSDSFVSNDIAVLANHLTSEYQIKDWTYQQTPQSILYCVREDGVLLACTLQPHHKVIGWSRFVTEGEYKAVTCIPGQSSRQDDVWTVVHRTVNGEDKYYLEKFYPWFNDTEAVEGQFLDCATYFEMDPPGNVLTGLEYLEGETLDVLADGTVHPPVVVTNGTVTLNALYSRVLIGYGYDTEVWPVLSELPMPDGSNIGRTQRIINLAIHFFRTLGCEIGRYSQDAGYQVEEKPFREARDTMGEQSPLYTGIVNYDYQEGFDNDPRFFIRQSQPLPMTVLGIVDTVEVLQ